MTSLQRYVRDAWYVFLVLASLPCSAAANVFGDGSDGALSVTSPETVVNVYAAVQDGILDDQTFTVDDASGLAAGDEILIIQVQHASDAGHYEFSTIDALDGNQITLTRAPIYTYHSGASNIPAASSAAQVVRVPHFTALEIGDGASIVAPAWNGQTGGVVVLRASESVTVTGTGRVDVSGRGYRGGAGVSGGTGVWGYAGEGHVGASGLTPPQADTQQPNGNGGGAGNGAPTGGAGGGHAAGGANGGDYNSNPGALGGASVGQPQMNPKLFFGGAGGSGGAWASYGGAGGSGGGIIQIFAPTIQVNAQSNGEAGGNGDTSWAGGGGGGGAGGSVYLFGQTVTLGAVEALGGPGGDGYSTADGGAGSVGRIVVAASSVTGTTSPAHASAPPVDVHGAYARIVLADRPVAYWRLGESAGTTAYDVAGGGYHGTYVNAPALGQPGAIDGDGDASIGLDGAAQYVSVPDSGALRPGSENYTLEAWVRVPEGVVQNAVILGKRQTSGDFEQVSIGIAGDGRFSTAGGQLAFLLRTDAANEKSGVTTASINDGQWHHVAVVFDASEQSVQTYLDGSPASFTYSFDLSYPASVDNPDPLLIGHDGSSSYLQGDVDEVAVYAAALTPELVAAHYASLPAAAGGLEVILAVPTYIGSADTSHDGKHLVVDGTVLTIDGAHSFASLRLINGATLKHSVQPADKLDLTVTGTLEVDATSRIDVSGLGAGVSAEITGYSGGSYGGRGGSGNGGVSNASYGDYREPVDFGTGGSGGSTRGGGVVKVVAGELVLEGEVLANGGSTSTGYRGGGSGGSVWLEVGVLRGGGVVRANGGNGSYRYTGGGGGGRVAIYYGDASGFDLSGVQAKGGAGSYGEAGEDGTVYFEEADIPLAVVSSEPAGYLASPLGQVTLRFNAAIDVATLSPEDASVSTPLGAVNPSSVTPLDAITYTLEFDPALTLDGTYTLTLGPEISALDGRVMDQDRDGVPGEAAEDAYSTSIVIDQTPPSGPFVTNYPVAEEPTALTSSTLVLEGTRDPDTAIWINGQRVVATGTGPWSAAVSLAQGENTVTVVATDMAGNVSDVTTLLFFVDSIPPRVTGVTPGNGSFFNGVPPIRIGFEETGSGLAVASSSVNLTRGGVPIAGDWALEGSELVFTPAVLLSDATYQVGGRLQDQGGLLSTPFSVAFTIDRIPPPAPILNPLPAVTTINVQSASGEKAAYSSIRLNGEQVVGNTSSTSWSYTVPLSEGSNNLIFTARDRAGNESLAAQASLFYDNTAPGPVTVLANGEGDGTAVVLDWAGYDEVANGNDVDHYTVYQGSAHYTDVASATPVGTVPAGGAGFTVTGLARAHTYFFAVVAVDTLGNARTTVSPVAVATVDTVPPNDVGDLSVQAFEDRLLVTWTAPDDAARDLAGYQVYTDGGVTVTPLPADTLQLELAGLEPATAYPIRITARDEDGNQSAGVEITGVTWLANPAGLAAESFSGLVDLSWQAVSPNAYVKHYAVYAAESDFTSVGGLTPRVIVPTNSTSARLAGLVNGTTYYLAVTAVNLSGGERQAVDTKSATPEADVTGPLIGDIQFDGAPLAEGSTLLQPGTLSLTATDPMGVARVEFYVDGILLSADANGANGYTALWDITEATDGAHALTFSAFDTLDNRSDVSLGVSVALAPPAAPSISQPQDGFATNQARVAVTGSAEPRSEVFLYVDGSQVAGPLTLDSAGSYQGTVNLAEGVNRIQAAAQNRGGTGPLSGEVVVTLDTSIPDAPRGLTATAREGGEIRLSWNAQTDSSVVGYDLYRAEAPFVEVAGASKLNDTRLTASNYTDLPPADVVYYYRVVAATALGTVSEPSGQASAAADATAPRASSIEYAPLGNHDPMSGRTAPGDVNVRVTVSEPLLAPPFLSLTPPGGVPISVSLSRVSESQYEGRFTITALTPSGIARAVFSARDEVGNRGTEVDEGATLLIDTDGPAVSELDLSPSHPIQNDQASPVTVTVSLALTEPVKAGTAPELFYSLSGAGRSEVPVDTLVQTAPRAWKASFALPSDAGLDEPELLQLRFQAVDDLDNPGDTIGDTNSFQVYQGDLPPLDTPAGLTAQALPDGHVALVWEAVAEATDYLVLRQGPGDTDLTAHARSAGDLTYRDVTLADGLYRYAVASVRQTNAQESVSAPSPSVEVQADAQAPEPPIDLDLELVGAGIRATWQAPAGDGNVTYSLYRAGGVEITSVEGLTPIRTGIAATEAIDAAPSEAEHAYAVTAVDAAGNESLPSASAYLNPGLLPVATLTVVQREDRKPVVSWTHTSGSIVGYDVYLGSPDFGPQLNAEPLTVTSFTDQAYAGDERLYTVVARDAQARQSLGRSLLLPAARAVLDPDSQVRRGVMNRLEYTVTNDGPGDVFDARLRVQLGGRDHVSQDFSLLPGESIVVPVVVGGYAELQDLSGLETTLELTPHAGERVSVVRAAEVPVTDAGLVFSLATESFTRGATGRVQFTLENTSDVEIDAVIATANGNAPSDELRFKLLDADGNVVTTAGFRQFVGEGVVTLASGQSVARIQPGARFTSEWVDVPVPAAAPDNLTLRVELEQLHYHLGLADEVHIPGIAASRETPIIDTAYYGEVSSITPASSFGDEPVVITGRAVDSASGEAMAAVPMKLVIAVNGFERRYDLYADAAGEFEYRFEPLPGESGIYRVYAIHPDVLDRPEQGQFTIGRVAVSPTNISLNLPRNYQQHFNIRASAGDGTTASNVRLVADPADQPTGEVPPGVTIGVGGSVNLGSGQAADLAFTVRGDDTTAETGLVVLKVLSDERADEPWAEVVVSYRFSEARPTLQYSPSYVQTGVARDGRVSETVTLENRGLAPLESVRVELFTETGAPAPGWLYLTSPAVQGSVAVGEQRTIELVAAPGSTVAVGDHAFRLRVTASNHPRTEIGVFVAVTEAGVGNVLFKLSDIYTGTADKATGEEIQGLSGAKVRVQNEDVLLIDVPPRVTDSLGEVMFTDLPAGRYLFRASAGSHQDVSGRFQIKAGQTAIQEVFLDYNLVTVEWSVTEITIEDRYEITLQATYETDVPAAVVVAEPSSITLPELEKGDVFYGEFTLTNYGNVRADNLQLALPPDDRYFDFDFLGGLPQSLEAKQRITVPYRMVMLESFEPEGDASGGGCYTYQPCASVTSDYVCANGTKTDSNTRYCWFYTYGQCSSSAGGFGGSGGGSATVSVGGGGGAGGYGGGPTYQSIQGAQCVPRPKECAVCEAPGQGKGGL